MKIPERIQKMTTTDGFYELWLEQVRKGSSYKEAFITLKQEYRQFIDDNGLTELKEAGIVKGCKYSSYDSFRIVRYRRSCNN